MKVFIESINCGIWNAIMNGPYVPMTLVNGVVVEKPFDKLTDVENKKVQYDCIAKNIINFPLYLEEFFRVSQCSSTKEICDIFGVTQEDTTGFKRARKHAMVQEYELYKMQ